MGFLSGGQQQVGTIFCLSCEDIILRDVISSHGENLQAVDFKGEIPAGQFTGFAVSDKHHLAAVVHKDVCAVVQIFFLIGEMRIPHFIGHWIRVHGHGPKTDPLVPYIQRSRRYRGGLCLSKQQRLHFVKGLFSVTVGPPELGVTDGKFCANMAAPQTVL